MHFIYYITWRKFSFTIYTDAMRRVLEESQGFEKSRLAYQASRKKYVEQALETYEIIVCFITMQIIMTLNFTNGYMFCQNHYLHIMLMTSL